MAKKLIKPIDILNDNPIDFHWDTFIHNIINGKYILVLGSEIMLSKNENVECNGDSTRLLFNSVKDDLIANNHIGADNRVSNFTELSQNVPDISRCVRNMVNDGLDYSISEMSPELVSLIKAKVFRIVLTTTIDPYIEILMREVWGEELKVMDISADPSSDDFDFEKYHRNDIAQLTPPTLYYVFGKAASSSRFVATDNDAIEIMAKWMSKENPNNFLTYVRSKRALALGCKLDDWFFRFFWYVLKGNVKGLSRGEVAVSLDETSESDSKLKSYLTQSKIFFRPDARSFISDLISKLETYKKDEPELIISKRRSGGIFLSYAHEDYDIVKTIFNSLTEAGLPVWFDERNLMGGDDYNTKIENEIANCHIIIPILSHQVSEDLANNIERYYKDVEWSMTQTFINGGKKLKVVPLRIWGYNVRDEDISSKLPDCIKNKTVHDLEKQSIDELVFNVRNLLNSI